MTQPPLCSPHHSEAVPIKREAFEQGLIDGERYYREWYYSMSWLERWRWRHGRMP